VELGDWRGGWGFWSLGRGLRDLLRGEREAGDLDTPLWAQIDGRIAPRAGPVTLTPTRAGRGGRADWRVKLERIEDIGRKQEIGVGAESGVAKKLGVPGVGGQALGLGGPGGGLE
jgi:hypothetical protein